MKKLVAMATVAFSSQLMLAECKFSVAGCDQGQVEQGKITEATFPEFEEVSCDDADGKPVTLADLTRRPPLASFVNSKNYCFVDGSGHYLAPSKLARDLQDQRIILGVNYTDSKGTRVESPCDTAELLY